MNDDFLKVTCPDCGTILIVKRRDGTVVEVRKPILEDSSGDRFEDAQRKVREEKDTIARKVAEAREKEKGKMDRLNALFNDALGRAKDEGPIEKNPNALDPD